MQNVKAKVISSTDIHVTWIAPMQAVQALHSNAILLKCIVKAARLSRKQLKLMDPRQQLL